jgi:tetratricopeptide (TPR) repeat protein
LNSANQIIGSGDSAYLIDPTTLRAVPLDAAAMVRCAHELVAQGQATADICQATAHFSKAAIYFAIAGDLPRAQQWIDRSFHSQAQLGSCAAHLMTAQIRRAQIMQLQGALQAAAAELENAVQRCRTAPALSGLLDFALQHLGKVRFDQRQFTQALPCFEEALQLRQIKRDDALIASTELAVAAAKRALAASAAITSKTV